MLRVKFIFEYIANIEEEVNKFLKQCDKQGFVVRNITYICVRETRYHVFIEYEDGVKTNNNQDRTKEY